MVVSIALIHFQSMTCALHRADCSPANTLQRFYTRGAAKETSDFCHNSLTAHTRGWKDERPRNDENAKDLKPQKAALQQGDNNEAVHDDSIGGGGLGTRIQQCGFGRQQGAWWWQQEFWRCDVGEN